jgi:hypothetical protein
MQEEVGKEIEDKKTELEPKVVEAYEGSPPEVKALFKDQKPVKVTRKNSAAVTKFLDELAKIGIYNFFLNFMESGGRLLLLTLFL